MSWGVLAGHRHKQGRRREEIGVNTKAETRKKGEKNCDFFLKSHRRAAALAEDDTLGGMSKGRGCGLSGDPGAEEGARLPAP